MNLETLQLFCHVARHQSFSRGALESNVTQSAASQAVRQLEEELGVRLLDRSKRPLEVTAEGMKFHRACRKLLEGFERVRAELGGREKRIAGTIRVAAIYSVGLHAMGARMQNFRMIHPEARVRLECLHPEEVVQSVLEDSADVGVLSYPPANRALTVVPLQDELMLLVCPPAHHLVRKRAIRLAELAGEPYVHFDGDLAVRKAVDRAFRRADVRPQVVMEFDNVESIKQAVSTGTGVSILPEPALQKELAIGTLVGIPIEGEPIRRPIALIYRRGKPLSPTVERFIEVLRRGEEALPSAVSAAEIGLQGHEPRRRPAPPAAPED